MKYVKIIVAHPFQQHSFKTARALKKNNNLYKYVTTVYLKKGTITYWLSKVLKGDNLRRTLGRKTEELSDNEVVVFSEWANLLLLFLQRVDKNRNLYNWWYQKTINIFNRSLFKYVKKEEIDAVIVYDTVSNKLVELVKKHKLKTKVIIDMSAPNALFMKQIFEDELHNMSSKDAVLDVSSKYFVRKCIAAKKELDYADAFLVASEFTRKSLEWWHINPNNIYKCTYGVYEEHKESIKKDKGVIRCCFVGKISLQKGAYRLFKIIDSVERSDMEFHFYGSYSKDNEYYKKYRDRCIFHGHVPHSKMLDELEKNDIIIFPSLADGFGFSVTEALLRQNIAICSKNAGVSELIIDGETGFSYSIGEENSVVSFLRSVSRDKLSIMQEKAPDSLKKYTWDKYSEQVNNAVNKVFSREK